ncbi:RraA family protein [Dickeya fangzhongdai]|uniref:Putative 4-hydroxy-4-methyl-2-oxoglutarate aldolase n=1 Tax=Dickeya fangzhongdai TaxID=1778540 RepID=A0A2K8QKF2_9GAMM|nr:RraA family protein [Dickeya fangzhongdai]ATZ93989.1 S-adenosylmethionine--2-demethylmenaquinone methyltransferase [Dickeya fangzhongdai]QOH47425.1 RraA family protein [Dickeya fangzhongdai]QOH51731.1 RraA family protein [Dickeya fangzhongdai]WOY01075.1 RraA family protein [Dickeya fangzhongdai]WOY03773.1 RraA family protein [Dickeya fangzhongdai]
MNYHIIPRVPPLSDDLLAGYRHISTSTLGHLTEAGYLSGIRPLLPDVQMVGNVVTVKLCPPDGGVLREALLLSQPGDVLVIDASDEEERACWGELRALAARVKGLAGVVVAGAVTDSRALRQLGLPVFCKGVSAITTRTLGTAGAVNVPVTVAGVTVQPGDVAIGDDDGVFILSPSAARDWLEKAQHKELTDTERRNALRRKWGK